MSMVDNKGRIPAPGFGQCVVRLVERGRTEGGLYVPGTTAADGSGEMDKYPVMVSTSQRFSAGAGLIVECDAQEGDTLVLEPNCPCTWTQDMPGDMRVVSLKNVLAWFPGKRREAH